MKGYNKEIKEKLKSSSISTGDRIRVQKDSQTFEGLLMPRSGGESPDYLVIKLDNGYNTGIEITPGTKIEKIQEGQEPQMGKKTSKIKPDPEKPEVSILGTGGTVASRIDYRTGAVHPAFSAEEIYNIAPEIADIANIETKSIYNVLSENINPGIWSEIANEVKKELNNEKMGVVIAHGTDTMGYTASALSFMLKNLQKPVVITGSQRSSDRPSSDAALNLICSVATAVSNLSGVFVVMHGSTEDEFCSIHRGTKVRKCHTSRRDAFQSINAPPIGTVKNKKVKIHQEVSKRSDEVEVEVNGGFEEKVALIKAYPGIKQNYIESLLEQGYKGIVLEGTGLGHTPESFQSGIKKAIERGVPVAMTSQCIWGRTNMRVYSTGRNLLKIGVFQLGDMLPETAYVKMMWALDKTSDMKEVKSLMKRNIAGEISDRTRPDYFLKPENQVGE